VDRAGHATPVDSGWRAAFDYPAISPDGRMIAATVRDKQSDLWIRRADGSRQRVNAPGVVNWRPSWFADSKSLAYVSVRDLQQGAVDVRGFRVAVDAGSSPREFLRHDLAMYEVELSADTQWVAFRVDHPQSGGTTIFVRHLHGDTTLHQLTAGVANNYQVGISPNGRWVAYVSNEDHGVPQVYIMSFPDTSVKRLVSRGQAYEPRWSRNGRELFFESGGSLMEVTIDPGAELRVSEPRPLFPLTGYRRARNRPQYDVAPGDQRFLMIKEPPPPPVPTIMFVEHWFGELRSKLKP
jgi:Tol biopolymer transport system component